MFSEIKNTFDIRCKEFFFAVNIFLHVAKMKLEPLLTVHLETPVDWLTIKWNRLFTQWDTKKKCAPLVQYKGTFATEQIFALIFIQVNYCLKFNKGILSKVVKQVKKNIFWPNFWFLVLHKFKIEITANIIELYNGKKIWSILYMSNNQLAKVYTFICIPWCKISYKVTHSDMVAELESAF